MPTKPTAVEVPHGGPAFPIVVDGIVAEEGMSLCEWYVGMAVMSGKDAREAIKIAHDIMRERREVIE